MSHPVPGSDPKNRYPEDKVTNYTSKKKKMAASFMPNLKEFLSDDPKASIAAGKKNAKRNKRFDTKRFALASKAK